MAHHIFQLETELQNIPEAAPKASRSFSVFEKLERYGSSALSGVEHLRLLVGKDSILCSAYAACGITGNPTPFQADLQLTRRVAAAAEILQINFLDHIIGGQGYFSFQQAGVLGCPF